MNTKSLTTGIAAGILLISLLALASTAAAEVVYTQVNASISGKGSIKLDLNHDGITDFVLHSVSQLTVCGNRGGIYGLHKADAKEWRRRSCVPLGFRRCGGEWHSSGRKLNVLRPQDHSDTVFYLFGWEPDRFRVSWPRVSHKWPGSLWVGTSPYSCGLWRA